MGRATLVLLKCIGSFYSRSPGWLRGILACSVGGLVRVLGFRKKVILLNLEIAFSGGENEKLRKKLYRQAYEHLGFLFFEISMVLSGMERFCERNVIVKGRENWDRAHEKGKGVLFLSGHVGNWEIMSALGGILNMNLMIVTKKLKPDWLHEAIEEGRARYGVSGTYEPRVLKDVMSGLKKGHTVGFILDQYAGPPIGVRVPFFGLPVGTNSAVAAVARRTGAPVLPVLNYRTSSGKVVIEVREPLQWIGDERPTHNIAQNTAHYVERLEKDVRAHPEQWLWSHRRFKGDLTPLKPDEWEQARARG